MRLRAKARLSVAAGALRLPAAILAFHRRRPPTFLTVLNYHRVDEPGGASETDEGTLDATPRSFDRQLALVRRHMTPVALDDILAFLGGRPLPPNPVLVTFDDGYRDNLDNALPLLIRHGIRATFFIATAYVRERRLFWWDQIAWIAKHARRRRFTLEVPEPSEVDLDISPADGVRRLLRLVKTWHGLDLAHFLDHLAAAADAPWTADVEARLVRRLVMTWDDVRSLRRAGMDIGSHTRTHRVLQTLPVAQLADELAGSRDDLEAELGERVESIAYPVGRPVAQVPALRQALETAGYRLGFSYNTGRQSLKDLDPLDIHRFSVENDEEDDRLLGRLGIPWLTPRGVA